MRPFILSDHMSFCSLTEQVSDVCSKQVTKIASRDALIQDKKKLHFMLLLFLINTCRVGRLKYVFHSPVVVVLYQIFL